MVNRLEEGTTNLGSSYLIVCAFSKTSSSLYVLFPLTPNRSLVDMSTPHHHGLFSWAAAIVDIQTRSLIFSSSLPTTDFSLQPSRNSQRLRNEFTIQYVSRLVKLSNSGSSASLLHDICLTPPHILASTTTHEDPGLQFRNVLSSTFRRLRWASPQSERLSLGFG